MLRVAQGGKSAIFGIFYFLKINNEETGRTKLPSQSAVKIPSGVHGKPTEVMGNCENAKTRPFEGPPFHYIANYVIFGPMGEDVNNPN